MNDIERQDPEVVGCHRRRNRPATQRPGDDRLGELYQPGRHAGRGQRVDEQVCRGLPGRRYYGGCEYVDAAENLARDRLKQIFRRRACQRPAALRRPGQHGGLSRVLSRATWCSGLDLAHGGHLTHGMKLNISGKLYHFYQLRRAAATPIGSTSTRWPPWPASTSRR